MSKDEQQVDEQVTEDKFGNSPDPVEDQDAEQSALAEAALKEVSDEEAADEKTSSKPAEESENLPTVETVAKLREQRRDDREARHKAEVETAELRGQMKGLQDRQVTEAELSPVAAEMKKQGVATEDELDLTTGEQFRLMRQETKWDTAQTAKKTAADAETTLQGDLSVQQKTAQDEDRGEGLDYGTIVDLGEKFLTAGDRLDIQNSKEPFEFAYRRCLRAIQEDGDESTKKTLQENLARKTKESAGSDTSEKKKKVVADEDETDDEEVDGHIVNPRLRALAQEQIAGGTSAT